jgi:quercetin dioxygenase-like cupin family protein
MNLLNFEDIKWRQFKDDSLGYPIDYQAALLNIRDDGHADMLYKWAPDSYCHFHRHTAITTSLVLSGELHVTDYDTETGTKGETRIRKAGDYASKDSGDVHMEKGGPEGALVLFNLFAQNGSLAESLSMDGDVLSVSDFASLYKRKKASST